MSEGFTGAHNGIYYKNGHPVCAVSQLGNLPPNQQKLVSMPDPRESWSSLPISLPRIQSCHWELSHGARTVLERPVGEDGANGFSGIRETGTGRCRRER